MSSIHAIVRGQRYVVDKVKEDEYTQILTWIGIKHSCHFHKWNGVSGSFQDTGEIIGHYVIEEDRNNNV